MTDQGVAIVCLSVAVTVLAISTAVLAGSVPFLWWRCFKLEAKVELLDAALADLMELAGVPTKVEAVQR